MKKIIIAIAVIMLVVWFFWPKQAHYKNQIKNELDQALKLALPYDFKVNSYKHDFAIGDDFTTVEIEFLKNDFSKMLSQINLDQWTKTEKGYNLYLSTAASEGSGFHRIIIDLDEKTPIMHIIYGDE